MFTLPPETRVIYLSAHGRDTVTAALKAKEVLEALGCTVVQESTGVRTAAQCRKHYGPRLRQCDVVLQLVGRDAGPLVLADDDDGVRLSLSLWEVRHAQRMNKSLNRILLDDSFPFDAKEQDSAAKTNRKQDLYRSHLATQGDEVKRAGDLEELVSLLGSIFQKPIQSEKEIAAEAEPAPSESSLTLTPAIDAEVERLAEQQRQEEQRRQAELSRQAEQARQSELKRQKEQARQSELDRQEELERQEEQRLQDELKSQEEQRLQQELKRREELQRQKALLRQVELQRQEEQRFQQEQSRREDQQRQKEQLHQDEAKAEVKVQEIAPTASLTVESPVLRQRNPVVRRLFTNLKSRLAQVMAHAGTSILRVFAKVRGILILAASLVRQLSGRVKRGVVQFGKSSVVLIGKTPSIWTAFRERHQASEGPQQLSVSHEAPSVKEPTSSLIAAAKPVASPEDAAVTENLQVSPLVVQEPPSVADAVAGELLPPPVYPLRGLTLRPVPIVANDAPKLGERVSYAERGGRPGQSSPTYSGLTMKTESSRPRAVEAASIVPTTRTVPPEEDGIGLKEKIVGAVVLCHFAVAIGLIVNATWTSGDAKPQKAPSSLAAATLAPEALAPPSVAVPQMPAPAVEEVKLQKPSVSAVAPAVELEPEPEQLLAQIEARIDAAIQQMRAGNEPRDVYAQTHRQELQTLQRQTQAVVRKLSTRLSRQDPLVSRAARSLALAHLLIGHYQAACNVLLDSSESLVLVYPEDHPELQVTHWLWTQATALLNSGASEKPAVEETIGGNPGGEATGQPTGLFTTAEVENRRLELKAEGNRRR